MAPPCGPRAATPWASSGPVFVPPDRLFFSSANDGGAFLLKVKVEGGKASAEEVWRNAVLKNHFHASVEADGLLFGFDNATLKLWTPPPAPRKWAARGFGKGAVVEADGLLFILADDGRMALAERTAEGFRQKGLFQAMTGKSWTAPTVAAGRLFLRDFDEIVAYDIQAGEEPPDEIVIPSAALPARAPPLSPWSLLPALGATPAPGRRRSRRRPAPLRGGARRGGRLERGRNPVGHRHLRLVQPPRALQARDAAAEPVAFRDLEPGRRHLVGARRKGPYWIYPAYSSPPWPVRTPTPSDAIMDRWALLEPPLLGARAKGHQVALLGRGDIDGTPTIELELTLQSGAKEKWHLDAGTYLETAVDATVTDFTQSGAPMNERSYPSDFRKVGKIVIPFKVERNTSPAIRCSRSPT